MNWKKKNIHRKKLNRTVDIQPVHNKRKTIFTTCSKQFLSEKNLSDGMISSTWNTNLKPWPKKTFHYNNISQASNLYECLLSNLPKTNNLLKNSKKQSIKCRSSRNESLISPKRSMTRRQSQSQKEWQKHLMMGLYKFSRLKESCPWTGWTSETGNDLWLRWGFSTCISTLWR